jgi:short-subunit dehydrogenase
MKSYVMITGALGGLGSAFALDCAKRGYDLFLTDIHPEGNGFATRLSEKFNIDVIYRPCDLSKEEARGDFLRTVREECFTFWSLINVAGLDHEGAFLEKNRSQILKILQINILATMDITHGTLQLRDPQKRFRLINVSSLAGFYPMPFKATYAASKRFILDFSRALREEIREFGTVTALCPAGLPTTNECMRAIFAQGFWGLATSMDPQKVARLTVSAALHGKAVVIPGWINQFIRLAGSLMPVSTNVRYVSKRWKKAQEQKDALILLVGTQNNYH